MPTVLITGANRGLGLEFARQYAAQGWCVHATCRDPARAEALKKVGGDIGVRALDIGDSAEIDGLAAALHGEPIDVLIANAGIGARQRTSLGDIDEELWGEVMRINVFAQLRLAEAFVPHVAASRRRIMLFLSSRAGSIADNLSGGRYIYRSSKAALNAVIKSLAIDLIPKRVTCVAIHPGWVKTDMGTDDAPLEPAESVAPMRALIERLEPHHNGRFLNYDGVELRW